VEIALIRSLSSNNYLAFFEGDMSPSNQERAIAWFKEHQISGITIGWNVAIDRSTGALSSFSDAVQLNRSPKWATYSVAEIESFAKLASENGLTVTLKPYFVDKDTAHNIAGWDNEWAATNAEAVKTTMAAYLLQTADMAQRTGADALIVGTENSNLSTEWAPQHKAWWDTTIAGIRNHFDGLLGYSEVAFPHFPSSSRDVDNVSFAASLDFIGANLYPPVSANTTPTYAEAVAAWTLNQKAWWSFAAEADAPGSVNLLTYLQGLSAKFGKPLVLTETGYPATDGAGSNPFKLGPTIDVAEQALLLQAEFDVVKTLGDWFGGVLLFSDSGYHYGENYEKSNAALTADTGYSVVDRPAAAVVGAFMAEYQHPILGGTGNDKLTDGAGDNIINGGGGFDSLTLGGKRTDYILTAEFGRHVLKGNTGEVNILDDIERLLFTDSKIAFDMNGNAGNAARLIGAILGTDALNIPAFTGAAINLLDSGMSLSQLAELGLNTGVFLQAAGSRSNTDVVKALYMNVTGDAAPDSALAYYVNLLDSEAINQADLAVAAAQTQINATHIDLVGLATIGLNYL
jgi:hypothetical protein